jgi:isopentenyldiphosphate isomerase
MKEYIDILNTKGEKTGKSLSYEETHKSGSIHRTVHVWLSNSKKQLLLQKRSKNKRAYPGMWDISVGGHISAGQASIEAAKRETKEELGIDLPDEAFTLLFVVRQPRAEHGTDFTDEEFNDVYLVNNDNEISTFSVQKSEVDEVRWIGLDEFRKWVMGKGEPMVPHPEEYRLLLERLG